VTRTIIGHGNSINDIHFHPVDLSLLLTASKDESVRLWNVTTGVCIAVFAGHKVPSYSIPTSPFPDYNVLYFNPIPIRFSMGSIWGSVGK
jgi:polycomb protein EED